jgi:hypothetical protein
LGRRLAVLGYHDDIAGFGHFVHQLQTLGFEFGRLDRSHDEASNVTMNTTIVSQAHKVNAEWSAFPEPIHSGGLRRA